MSNSITLVLGDHAVLKDHHLQDMKIVIDNNVPEADHYRVMIIGCIFDRCDLSEVRDILMQNNIFRQCTLPPFGVVPMITVGNNIDS